MTRVWVGGFFMCLGAWVCLIVLIVWMTGISFAELAGWFELAGLSMIVGILFVASQIIIDNRADDERERQEQNT